MKLLQSPEGLRIAFEHEEVSMLEQLVLQLILLLESQSTTALDPDPLFASLEVGGNEERPDDPALLRLLPDAFSDEGEASEFRRVTEQGLINRKLHDAQDVARQLADEATSTLDEAIYTVTPEGFLPWARTLTALRLAMAARIGLTTVEDYERLIDEEGTRGTVLVYDWLAALLEAIITLGDDALEQRGDATDS